MFTHNNPLTYVMSTAKLNATGLRWVAELSNFNFDIKYRPGRVNSEADALSRKPLMNLTDCEDEYVEVVTMDQLDKAMSASAPADPP